MSRWSTFPPPDAGHVCLLGWSSSGPPRERTVRRGRGLPRGRAFAGLGRLLFEPTGWRLRNPWPGRFVGRQRGPRSSALEYLRLLRARVAYELVSSRSPAITAKAWPELVKIVIHWPRPRLPKRKNELESSGLLSSPAWISAYETVPEQS